MANDDVRRIRTYQTNGAAAYNMYAVPLEQPEQTPLPEEQLQPKPQKRIRVRARISVTPFGVVGAMAVALLLTLVIFGYVRLYETTTEVSALQDEVDTLADQNTVLSTTYESRIDLNVIEETAISQLGMSQPSSSQTVYLNLSGTEDKAEIYTTQKSNPLATAWRALKSGLEDLVAYFS